MAVRGWDPSPILQQTRLTRAVMAPLARTTLMSLSIALGLSLPTGTMLKGVKQSESWLGFGAGARVLLIQLTFTSQILPLLHHGSTKGLLGELWQLIRHVFSFVMFSEKYVISPFPSIDVLVEERETLRLT